MKSNARCNNKQPRLSSNSSSLLSSVNRVDCSPPGKQPVTRCNHCHVLFPSLYELNNHFLTEHNVILQAEMEHTKSWKSHTIDDACLQGLTRLENRITEDYTVHSKNMKVILSHPNNMNTSGYPCPNCDYVAKWPTELQKHIMVHSKQRPHRCIICGLSYKWKWDLGRHFDKSHNRTMNPYKKNVFSNSLNQENRQKVVRSQKSSIRKHAEIKQSLQLAPSMVDYIPFSISPTNIDLNQRGEICNSLKHDISMKSVNRPGYNHMQSV
ncbi:unnamed protein product [Heterobilharzia americana]|nr:unnamed protein product [Heterobilharzia americana]